MEPQLAAANSHGTVENPPLDIVHLLLLQTQRRRGKGEPASDAFTVLSKIAHNYPAVLDHYWNWTNDMVRGQPSATSLSQVLLDALQRTGRPLANSAGIENVGGVDPR